MNAINFNTKEEYLAWTAEWKAEYKQLSADIRAAKHAYKAAQRSDVYNDIQNARIAMGRLKYKANEMITLRLQSKFEAQRQYLAQKEAA